MSDAHNRSWFEKFWHWYCRAIARIFYRHIEIEGAASIATGDAGLLLCANHVNALVDVVLLQATTTRTIRPLARSGLYLNPLLRPLLHLIGAVPVARRNDVAADLTRNDKSFTRCAELLAADETIVIFPEGQSHSDSHIHKLKTGAARIALAAAAHNGRAPVILPVGLTFTRKGKFRSDVLIQFGTPLNATLPDNIEPFAAVELLTARITEGLAAVTLNADSWEDIYLVNRLEQFFALRHGKYRKRKLRQRFCALQRLIDAQRALRVYEPDRVRAILLQLTAFERLCRMFGIRDYHLTIDARPVLVMLYFARLILVVLLTLPIAIWGTINGIVPYLLTRHGSRRIARSEDQYDTAKVLLGMLLFLSFWSVQTILVYRWAGAWWSIGYLGSVLLAAPIALRMRKEYRIIWSNLKVFFLFLRKRQLRAYLADRRHEIEVELAHLVRIVKRLPETAGGSEREIHT